MFVLKKGLKSACLILALTTVISYGFSAKAEPLSEVLEYNRSLPVDSNQITDWPKGPVINAESAILIEAETGAILYAKNIHKKEFPASTTKILSTLIASESCELDEIVDFNHDDVFGIPRDSNNIAIDEGESLNVEECLNAILIRSANEVCLGLARHISGSYEDFAALMNQRAVELGCVDSNFVNPNGLPDDNHYTSAYDLAMIGKAFFDNQFLCEITTTPRLKIYASNRQPDDIIDSNKMDLIKGREYEYEYLVGCKTGYTEVSRSSIVSCAEKDGLKLICVVMKDEAPFQYEDTISLFNYGFSNFEKIYISKTESKYNLSFSDSFYSGNTVFGNLKPLLFVDENAYVIMPIAADAACVSSEITYGSEDPDTAAYIRFCYSGADIGIVPVLFRLEEQSDYEFDLINTSDEVELADPANEEGILFVNLLFILQVILALCIPGGIIFLIVKISKNFHFSINKRLKWKRSRRSSSRRRKGRGLHF